MSVFKLSFFPSGVKLPYFFIFTSCCLFFGFMSSTTFAAENKLEDGFSTTHKTQQMGQSSQRKIDHLANQSRELFNQYQKLLNQAQYQQEYNKELALLQQQQLDEIALLKQQIADIKITQQKLTPLLRDMVKTLAEFIQLDLPFQRQERLESTHKLLALLNNSQVATAEKFRRVMELYQTENDYNYDMQVYRETVNVDGRTLSVQLLRIGRSMLYFQTTDAQQSALWNKKTQKWQIVDSAYNMNISKAIRVASKQAAPELLSLPITIELDDLNQADVSDVMEAK